MVVCSGGSRRKKHPESRCILKGELTGFTKRLNVEEEREGKRQRMARPLA